MRRLLPLLGIIPLLAIPTLAQELTGPELLEKTIAYHDPDNNWKTFKGTFQVTMETPNSSKRISKIGMDLPKSIFELQITKDGDSYGYQFNGDTCETSLNGTSKISEADIKKFRLTCERGKTMRDYYTYLYGLPMKLKDPGTVVHKAVERRPFKGKEYLVLKVNYDEGVGKDTWYFYFDPQTYAMEVYQFFHEEPKNDGEYILLSGLEEIKGIKMPKTRKWYYNKDDKFLGVDLLN